ncbi:cysteine dioxygenase [Actinacidiphila sp. bgisy144]|uniref:cysteine dioxygenase n=1 Tax=Actinacidiphila sp. bgisy144 TaxID=3413791 RepID=UPI003EB789E0
MSAVPASSPASVVSPAVSGAASGPVSGPAASDTQAAPTAAELLAFARSVAADPDVVGELPLDAEGRTWRRLEGPGGAEAWLIGWPPGAETGWHDHGGSYGVFVTAAGELTEHSLAVPLPTEGWRSLELAEGVDRRRVLPEGKGRAFGREHVHQVVNASGTTHAVSVHAYYPPLPLMRRYSRKDSTLRLEYVERPEAW